jgi:hypothetical protein
MCPHSLETRRRTNNKSSSKQPNEENALINGSSTSTQRPWGNATTAFGFDGLVNLITTANATPSNQVQVGVGTFTFSHLDAQIRRLWIQGGQQLYMIMNPQEVQSVVKVAEGSGAIIRVMASANADAVAGLAVTGYKHSITGETIPIMASRYLAPGTIIFGSKFLPDGSPAADVNVLPQVQLPSLAPNESVQGRYGPLAA